METNSESSLEFDLSLENLKIHLDKPRCNSLKYANILVVEDNKINQKIMILCFRNLVNNIDVANNGQEAVEKFIANKYDIIFMDLQMPVIDGLQATKIIREIEARSEITRTPIIAVNVSGGEYKERENCLNAGFDAYFNRFCVKTIVITMKKLLMIPFRKLVVLTGAGISKESGIDTFRDLGGIWEQFDFMEVCHINGWNTNPLKILNFMNNRRSEYQNANPNDAHRILAELETDFDVTIITQNIDNLHERGGNANIIHLHGEITKARSSIDPNLIIDIRYDKIKLGDKAPDGSQLRPHVVMFGEAVPLIQTAIDAVKTADIFVIIGTSLNVFPASKLIHEVKEEASIYLIDPHDVECYADRKIIKIQEMATIGTRILKDMLIEKSNNQ